MSGLKGKQMTPSAVDPGSEPGRNTDRELPNFDRVAVLYRWAEYLALGPLLQRTRNGFLGELRTAQHALVLGDGDGRFAAALLRAAPALRLHAVDASAAMLRLLAARCARDGNGSRLTVTHGPVQRVRVPAGCDLIATHFLLDCLTEEEVMGLAHRLAAGVQPGCRWVISEFGRPTGRVARPLSALYVRLLYLAFRLLTGLRVQHLPDPAQALRDAGFVRTRRTERLRGLLYAEIWEFAPHRLRVGSQVNSATSRTAATSTLS